jgi:copper chaperone CopZ
MKTHCPIMKTTLRTFLAVLISVVSTLIHAADPAAQITYTGEISGVVCASCKEHITTMLTKKLDGVVSVNLEPGEKLGGPQKLTIVAKNAEITKETATTALGSYAKNYEIVSLAKKS